MGYILSDTHYMLQCVAMYINYYQRSPSPPVLPYESMTMGPGLHSNEIPKEVYTYLRENL